MRAWILGWMVLLGAFAGCSGTAEDPAGSSGGANTIAAWTFSIPDQGDVARYESDFAAETITVLGLIPVDGPGFSGLALHLHYDLERDFGSGRRFSDADDFVALGGGRVLSTAPCGAFGLGYGEERPCPASTRASGTYLAQGLPALRGAAAFWMESLPVDQGTISATWLGDRIQIPYSMRVDQDCLVVEIREGPSVTGQRFGPLPQLASELTYCEESPWPTSFHLGRETYRRTSLSRGSFEVVPDPLGETYWLEVDPAARSLNKPASMAPLQGSIHPDDAIDAYLTQTSEGRAIKDTGNWTLRNFRDVDHGFTSAVGQQLTSSSEVELRIEFQGKIRLAKLTQECDLMGCRTQVKEQREVAAAFTVDSPLSPSLSYESFLRKANATFGKSAIGAYTGRAIVDGDAPDVVTPHFTVTFWFPAASFGVPYAITYDLASGRVLAVDAPTRTAGEQLGIDPSALG